MAGWAAFSSCSDSPSSPAETGGTISGAVRDGTTGVAGATLALSGAATRNATSNAAGSYSFSNLAAGSYSLAITTPTGYALATGETANKAVTLATGQTATVNFAVTAVSGGNVVTVNTVGTTFSPATLNITRGTTVRWVNNGTLDHTVTPSGHTEWSNAGLPAGGSFEHTFNTAGTFNYFCTPHQALGMTGSVHVD